MMLAVSDTILPLWIFVIVGGTLSLGLMIFVAWQGKGAATKRELHEEVGGLEKRVDSKFEQERSIAREANSRLHSRMDDVATGVTRVETKMDEQAKLLTKLFEKNFPT